MGTIQTSVCSKLVDSNPMVDTKATILFATVDRPLIIAKESVNGLTQGEYYRIHQANTSSGNTRIYTLEGVQVGWMTGRVQIGKSKKKLEKIM